MNPVDTADVFYPESDGKPIGESDWHIDWMANLRSIFKHWYRGQHVYVGTALLVYYVEGVPEKFVVPDVFVVKDADPGRRNIYKLWEEGQPPQFVIELTSIDRRQEDQLIKPKKYAQMRVGEYFLYDPLAEYLNPPLAGYRLDGDDYIPIEPDESGRLHSEELGLYLRLEEGQLVLYDADSGERLKSTEEAERDAEDEVRRLREKLRQHGLEEE